MSAAYRDPTSEAAERNEELPCGDCMFREEDKWFSKRAWCDHPKWIGNETGRPQTGGRNPMRKCAWHEPKLTSSIFRKGTSK